MTSSETGSENTEQLAEVVDLDGRRRLDQETVRWLLTGEGEVPKGAIEQPSPITLVIPDFVADLVRKAAAAKNQNPQDFLSEQVMRGIAISSMTEHGFRVALVRERTPMQLDSVGVPLPPEVVDIPEFMPSETPQE